MIIADTSIWIEHFRSGNKYLHRHLDQGQIVMHPFVTSELALGSLRDRANTLALLDSLPQVRMANDDEVRHLIETRGFYALGIVLVDAHLIASILINSGTLLWTHDKPLRKVADTLGIRAAIP